MVTFNFELVKGHGVASGLASDPRFFTGTIALQLPFFQALGLNIDHFHQATLNAQFNCQEIILKHVDYRFKKIKWHQDIPAEDFCLSHCRVLHAKQSYPGIIYQPVIKTKTEHFHPKNQLEILAPFIANIKYGDALSLAVTDKTLTMING